MLHRHLYMPLPHQCMLRCTRTHLPSMPPHRFMWASATAGTVGHIGVITVGAIGVDGATMAVGATAAAGVTVGIDKLQATRQYSTRRARTVFWLFFVLFLPPRLPGNSRIMACRTFSGVSHCCLLSGPSKRGNISYWPAVAPSSVRGKCCRMLPVLSGAPPCFFEAHPPLSPKSVTT